MLTWKSNHRYKLKYEKMAHVTFLTKNWNYQENWAPDTQE